MHKMSRILRNFRFPEVKKCRIRSPQLRNFKHTEVVHQSFQLDKRKNIGPLGWLLLGIPASTFALGTWQVQRKKWKENLITELKSRTSTDPVELPQSLEEISKLEYHPVHVRGRFLHDKEMYIGPRSLMQAGDAASTSSLISRGQSTAHGYLVVTPFKLANREETILINRGWVSNKRREPKTRPAGQVQEEVDVVGVIRLHESRPTFMPANQPDRNTWFYRDLLQMCETTGANPIFLDATNDFDIAGGPVGGQTRISLRNEHMSYILTWYSLCAVSSFMWYAQFIKKARI